MNILTGNYVAPDTEDDTLRDEILAQFSKYPFELDHFQRHAVERIHRNEHVLIMDDDILPDKTSIEFLNNAIKKDNRSVKINHRTVSNTYDNLQRRKEWENLHNNRRDEILLEPKQKTNRVQ